MTRDGQIFVGERIRSVADKNSAHVVGFVLVVSGEGMIHGEHDVHSEKRRIVLVQNDRVERDAVLRYRHFIEQWYYIQVELCGTILNRFESRVFDIEIDVVIPDYVLVRQVLRYTFSQWGHTVRRDCWIASSASAR